MRVDPHRTTGSQPSAIQPGATRPRLASSPPEQSPRPSVDFAARARTLLERCDELGRCSEHPQLLVRRALTAAHAEANERCAQWMREAGLDVRIDAMGNVIGRREGSGPTLRIGSHLDTVRDAGKYDGPLGVLAGITIADVLRDEALPFALEVIGFSDEEGVRFGRPFLGSRALAGTLRPDDLALADAEGTTLADAVRAFGGLEGPVDEAVARCAIGNGAMLGYLEIHIEQGPVLESVDAALGVVTGIAGHVWQTYRFTGRAGHAGTTPMRLRRDALAAAAELAIAVEELALSTPSLVATVGRIEARPGGHNVIAGAATLEVDVRSIDEDRLAEALSRLHAQADSVAARRGLALSCDVRFRHPPVACDEALRERLVHALRETGVPVHELPSGAGHDARVIAARGPVAMLFVRSPEGLSHHPEERVHEADVALALEVGCAWVRAIASKGPGSAGEVR